MHGSQHVAALSFSSSISQSGAGPRGGMCPVCSKTVAVRASDGKLWAHGPSLNRCLGSGGAPRAPPGPLTAQAMRDSDAVDMSRDLFEDSPPAPAHVPSP